MTRSLLAYATDPCGRSPFAPDALSRLDDRGALLSSDLDAAAIATDLAARGITATRSGSVYASGRRLPPADVAEALGALFDEAADALPLPSSEPLAARLAAARRASSAHTRAALATLDSADRSVVADEVAEAVSRAQAHTSAASRRNREGRRLASALESLAPSPGVLVDSSGAVDEEATRRRTAHREITFYALRAALRATARTIRTRPRVAAALAPRVISHLPPTPDVEDASTAPRDEVAPSLDEARSWLLDTYGAHITVRQSSIHPAYVEAGAPGSVPKSTLLALARATFGAPAMLRGFPTFRPAGSLGLAATSTPQGAASRVS